MANEATISSLTSAGTRASYVLAAAQAGLDRVLHDPTALGAYAVQVPYDVYGSDATKVARKPAPVAFASASSETSGGASNTAYTPVSFSLQPVRKYVKFQVTDLVAVTDPPTNDPGDPRFAGIVRDIVNMLAAGVALTITDVIAALFTGLSTTAGTSTAVLTVDDIYDAMFSANLSNVPFTAEDPAICVLHNVQINHLKDSLRGEQGVMQFQQPTAELLKANTGGVVGLWNNILFIQSDSCPLSDTNTNRNGALFARDCFAYQMLPVAQAVAQVPLGQVILASEMLWIEMGRDSDNGMTTYYGNIFLGAAEAGEDLRGVRIRTSAT